MDNKLIGLFHISNLCGIFFFIPGPCCTKSYSKFDIKHTYIKCKFAFFSSSTGQNQAVTGAFKHYPKVCHTHTILRQRGTWTLLKRIITVPNLLGSVLQWTTSRCGPARPKVNLTAPWLVSERQPKPCPIGMQRVACETCQKGTAEVCFGSLSTRALERSQSEPHWHGSLQKMLERSIWLASD